ncbi:MAG: prepilin-type N-terminal cleavage/methylation domain-containing protein [Spirochaetes bacterium]|nr:prepilin-type N-terminal cleavage/methylation domain-containing protein [Spirochaetota bacterium]
MKQARISQLSSDEGFTLIELAVATTIASIILLMAYTSYRTILQSIGRLTDREAYYEAVNNAYTFIDRDISNTYYRVENAKICLIGDLDGNNSVLNSVSVIHNEFNYQGNLKTPYPVSDIREIGYYLQRDPNHYDRFNLIRREEIHYDDDPEHGGEQNLLLPGVKALKFEFKEGNEWTDRWDSRQDKRYPSAIKTTIRVTDYENKDNTFIFVSMVNLQ